LIICDQNKSIESILLDAFSENEDFVELMFAHSIDDAIETVVMKAPDISFVNDVGIGDRTRNLLVDLDVTGVKNNLGANNSIVAVVSPEHIEIETELVDLGGQGLIPNDTLSPEVLRYILRFSLDLKRVKNTLRADKEDLIRQLIDMRDTREREVELGFELTEIAEELSIVKDELEESLSEKNKLFSIIAHDLRTPFLPLLTYTEMLSSDADNMSSDNIKKHAKTAHAAGGRVYQLLESLLEWSMVQMDNIRCNPEVLQVGNLTDEVFDALAQVSTDKNIELESKISDESACFDRNMITTVIRNLVSNAIKFTNTGGKVTVSAQLENNNPDYLEISVTDSGIGLSQEEVESVFSFKETIKSKGTNGEPGSGLGVVVQT